MTVSANEQTPDAGVKPGEVLLEKYRVERVIGVGGMGCVVEAWHMVFEERVAIKLLHGSLLDNEEAMQRFEREARVLFKLQSENVCRVIDYGQLESGIPFMVMEHLDGQDLASMLEKRVPLPLERCVDYALQACSALAHAHVRDIVHRDLKPENLFIVQPAGLPTLKLLDFGLSKIRTTGETKKRQRKLTSQEQVMGTPQYMSPEQWLASKDVGPRTDQWALGVILFEMMTGRLPFDGEQLASMCSSILNNPTPSVVALRPDAPPGIDVIIRKALEKEPQDRYENIGAFAVALSAFASPGAAAKAETVLAMLQRTEVHEDSGQWSVIKQPAYPSDLSRTMRRPPRFDALIGQLRSITSTSWQRMLRQPGGSRAAVWFAAIAVLALVTTVIWVLSRPPAPAASSVAQVEEPVVNVAPVEPPVTTARADEEPSAMAAPSASTKKRRGARTPAASTKPATKAKPGSSGTIFDDRF